ncbi:triacylglycerol lipase [Aquabacterium sp. A7-Y]|uniref:esterase/lipase family protein n=1 Tax=Aquabacterium sp. A7-Y TaxID=1349605 RepID=UPI00223CC250|nr:triacylglycerol lipase [Aquabacterium sp. A7-Y]MCW7538957.1 triacylglycerol lipase [Aquabacterium sp. A7-Y]
MNPSLLARFTIAGACLAAAASNATRAAEPADSGYTRTRYPIVLVAGLLGFEKIGSIDYFYGIPAALQDGGATVYGSAVSAANSSEVRGEQLLRELRALQQVHGHARFNLVGHSHGGPTIRYVAAVAPELVASVTTVATPHFGSKTADGIEHLTSWTGTTGVFAEIANALARLIGVIAGSPELPQDSLAALQSLNTRGALDFNRRFPQGAPTRECGVGPAEAGGVRYYSAGGTEVHTNALDVADVLMVLTGTFFGSERNDGLVGRCSSHWGQVLRSDYGWNHLDAVNHTFGLRGAFAPDPVQFYRNQANRLRLAGL